MKTDIVVDSVEIIQFIETNNDRPVKAIAFDQYFIYKDSLYNSPFNAAWICKFKYSDNLTDVISAIGKSSFKKELLNNKENKKLSLHDFFLRRPELKYISELLKSEDGNKHFFILYRKACLIFDIFNCNCDMQRLASGSTHDKYLEADLFQAWNGKFLLPLQIGSCSNP